MRLGKSCGPLWAAIFFSCFQGSVLGQVAVASIPTGTSVTELFTEASRLLVDNFNDPQLHFVRGMALAEMGRYLEAVDEFRWVLTFDPSQVRPRLELARVLMLLKQYDSARYNFEQALADDLPDTVRQNVLNALSVIREKTATLNLSFELLLDSNPSQATSAEEIEIRGLRYKISNDGRANHSAGAKVAFDGRLPLGEDALTFVRTQGEVQEFQDKRFNFQYLQVAAGHHFPFQRHTLTLEAGGHTSTYGNNLLYEGMLFGICDYYQARNDLGVRLALTSQQLNYKELQYLSAWQNGLSLQGFYTPSSASRWEGNLGLLKSAATEAPYSFFQASAGIRYAQEWVGGWMTGFAGYLSSIQYAAADPIFLETRHDIEQKIEFDLSNRRLRIWRFTPRLLIGQIERDSSIDFYSYTRRYFRIGLSTDF